MRRLAIYLYDQTITFSDQIDHIWFRRFSLVTGLFSVLHLSTIAIYVLYIISVFSIQCQAGALQLISVAIKLNIALAVRLVPHTRLRVTLPLTHLL